MRLYFIAALTDFLQVLFLFAATRYIAEHQQDAMPLGILGACNFVAYAVSCGISGHLSDRFGRRRLVVLGSLVFVIAFTVALRSLDPPLVYVAVVLSGTAAGMVFPPVMALITAGQVSGDHGRAASAPIVAFCIWWNVGVFFGQSSGGLLFQVGPEACLYTALTACVIIAPLILSVRRRPPAAIPVDTTRRSEPENSAAPRSFAVTAWLANLSGAFTASLIIFIFPKLATSLEIPSSTHGFMLAAMRAVVIGMYILLHFSQFWRHRMWPSFAAQAVAVFGLLLLATGNTAPLLTAGLMCAGVMTGYIYFTGIFYSTTSFHHERKGLASGIHEGTYALGFTGGALGGAYLVSVAGIRAPFEISIAVLLSLMVVQLLTRVIVRGRMRKTRVEPLSGTPGSR